LCSYVFTPVGCPFDVFDAISEPVDMKIFFAGEHTISNFYGTVHGAHFSGLREAARISNDKELFEYATSYKKSL